MTQPEGNVDGIGGGGRLFGLEFGGEWFDEPAVPQTSLGGRQIPSVPPDLISSLREETGQGPSYARVV